MNHQAIRVTHANGRALICLVGKDHAGQPWEHIRTLAEVDAEVGDVADVVRRQGAKHRCEVVS